MSPADLEPNPGPPPDAAPAPADAAEAEAWAAVLAAWEDEAAHRAYLARAVDLDGLACAGRRYRAVLEARPGDPVAARWRDEIVKRATAAGLAQLPRAKARAPSSLPRIVRWVMIGLFVLTTLKTACTFAPDAARGVGELWPR